MLDLLLPQRCAACGRHGSSLCPGCLAGLPRVRAPLCERCGAPTAWPVARCRECAGRRLAFARARASVRYEAGARALVGAWKERGLRALAGVAADVVAAELAPPEGCVLVPVPADRERLRRRGDHPAASLAGALGERWELPVAALLRRRGSSRRQRGLTLRERRLNVAGAFAAEPSPRAVCLVDDVYTTGATVSAAATELRRSGARRVVVVTFARAVRDR